MASTLTTQASIKEAAFRQNFYLQGASTDTVAESVTITHLLPGILNATDASQRLRWQLVPLDASQNSIYLYEVSRGATTLVLARQQLASATLNSRVIVSLDHSVSL